MPSKMIPKTEVQEYSKKECGNHQTSNHAKENDAQRASQSTTLKAQQNNRPIRSEASTRNRQSNSDIVKGSPTTEPKRQDDTEGKETPIDINKGSGSHGNQNNKRDDHSTVLKTPSELLIPMLAEMTPETCSTTDNSTHLERSTNSRNEVGGPTSERYSSRMESGSNRRAQRSPSRSLLSDPIKHSEDLMRKGGESKRSHNQAVASSNDDRRDDGSDDGPKTISSAAAAAAAAAAKLSAAPTPPKNKQFERRSTIMRGNSGPAANHDEDLVETIASAFSDHPLGEERQTWPGEDEDLGKKRDLSMAYDYSPEVYHPNPKRMAKSSDYGHQRRERSYRYHSSSHGRRHRTDRDEGYDYGYNYGNSHYEDARYYSSPHPPEHFDGHSMSHRPMERLTHRPRRMDVYGRGQRGYYSGEAHTQDHYHDSRYERKHQDYYDQSLSPQAYQHNPESNTPPPPSSAVVSLSPTALCKIDSPDKGAESNRASVFRDRGPPEETPRKGNEASDRRYEDRPDQPQLHLGSFQHSLESPPEQHGDGPTGITPPQLLSPHVMKHPGPRNGLSPGSFFAESPLKGDMPQDPPGLRRTASTHIDMSTSFPLFNDSFDSVDNRNYLGVSLHHTPFTSRLELSGSCSDISPSKEQQQQPLPHKRDEEQPQQEKKSAVGQSKSDEGRNAHLQANSTKKREEEDDGGGVTEYSPLPQLHQSPSTSMKMLGISPHGSFEDIIRGGGSTDASMGINASTRFDRTPSPVLNNIPKYQREHGRPPEERAECSNEKGGGGGGGRPSSAFSRKSSSGSSSGSSHYYGKKPHENENEGYHDRQLPERCSSSSGLKTETSDAPPPSSSSSGRSAGHGNAIGQPGPPTFYISMRRWKKVFSKLTFLLPGLRGRRMDPNMGDLEVVSLYSTESGKDNIVDEERRKAEFMPEPSPSSNSRGRKIKEPTVDEITIATRRLTSAVCAFGGGMGQSSSQSNSWSIFRSKNDGMRGGRSVGLIKSEGKLRYEEQLPNRYYELENRISWEVEENPPIEMLLDDDHSKNSISRRDKARRTYRKNRMHPALPGMHMMGGHYDPSNPYAAPSPIMNTSPSLMSVNGEPPKMRYRCKLCGQPKQNHTCPYQQSLQRSIGTMVYPAINAFTAKEPGELAPALSEMNNFMTPDEDEDGKTPETTTSSGDATKTEATTTTTTTAAAATDDNGSVVTSMNIGSGRTTLDEVNPPNVSPESRSTLNHAHSSDPASPGSSLSTGSTTPQSTPLLTGNEHSPDPDKSNNNSSNSNDNSHDTADEEPSSSSKTQSHKQNKNKEQGQQPQSTPSVSTPSLLSSSSSSSLSGRKRRRLKHENNNNTSFFFVETTPLKPEQYRIITTSLAETHPEAYEYPSLPLPYGQRKRLSDSLFAMSKEIPGLTDECAVVLREARQRNLWDLAVAELLAQVVVVIHCPAGDNTFNGLRKYLLTIGISC